MGYGERGESTSQVYQPGKQRTQAGISNSIAAQDLQHHKLGIHSQLHLADAQCKGGLQPGDGGLVLSLVIGSPANSAANSVQFDPVRIEHDGTD